MGEIIVDYADREIETEASNDAVDELFDELWKAREYTLRARHAEAHEVVRRLARAGNEATQAAPSARVPRNAECPCGSGRKYKRCCAFKPTATILPEQRTVNVRHEDATLEGRGRHDPCVLPRAARDRRSHGGAGAGGPRAPPCGDVHAGERRGVSA